MIRIQGLEECYFNPFAALVVPFKEGAHHFEQIDPRDPSTLIHLGYGIILLLPVINWIALATIFRKTDIATIKEQTLNELKSGIKTIQSNDGLSDRDKCKALERLCIQSYVFPTEFPKTSAEHKIALDAEEAYGKQNGHGNNHDR